MVQVIGMRQFIRRAVLDMASSESASCWDQELEATTTGDVCFMDQDLRQGCLQACGCRCGRQLQMVLQAQQNQSSHLCLKHVNMEVHHTSQAL